MSRVEGVIHGREGGGQGTALKGHLKARKGERAGRVGRGQGRSREGREVEGRGDAQKYIFLVMKNILM